ncbi:hypothetical protein [Novosphingobium capsulatum]|uniref:hypothetical protein n=1 Tax=Novosphingobium capsulatum TaxID=13688 RepID=UPI002E0D9E71|nr:hypothetical protein U0041_03955 [Novosphingobium capsulatum]
MTEAMRQALKWLRERGDQAAVARVKGGGWYLLAQGDVAPFQPATYRRLVDAGLAEFVTVGVILPKKKVQRFRLTDAGKAAK